MKAQHDILARYARGSQLLSDGTRGAIVLDPHLAALDIDVDDGAMNPANTIPTDVHQLIVVTFGVFDDFGLNLAMGRFVPRIFGYDVANDLAVTF
jgi:hypothetical protein